MTATFPDDFNLADYWLFDRIREGKGDRVAIRFGELSYSYAEVAERARALARYLAFHGVTPESRVYIVLPDLPPFAWSIFGTLACGGVVAMGNPIAPPEDLAHTLAYVKATALITTPAVAEALASRAGQFPHLSLVILVPDAATGDDPEVAVESEAADEFAAAGIDLLSLTDALDDVRKADDDPSGFYADPLPPIRRDDPAIWLFTSGSTGKSKAAMHSHRDFAFNTEVYAKRTVGYRESDVCVSVPRLFFGYATGTNLWFPFAVGATVGLFSERPTAESVIAAIQRYRATIVTNVPTMLGKILDLDDQLKAKGERGVDLSSVRFHLSAGEALPEPLLRRFTERFGAEVYDGIGSAEMFHIYASNRPGDIKPGSLGRAVEGYTLKILPEEADGSGATALAPNEIGVLWVKGDSVAHGYFQDRDNSWKTFHGHWCRTGDLFHIDDQGYLYFSGRADDLFKVGGIFVAPREVEECLLAHPAVSVAAVIPAADGGLTKPKAVIEVRPDARPQIATPEGRRALADELKAHVQGKLTKHK
ncbi:MAG: AMP-binding protein, partial [Deltaproteobacteria bacterium]|nr:AMP-binding protein [Deltaproteobacteria bacterium]